jgi:prepilin-type N-terminal cleavage/methylation domain-containing protein
MKKIKKIKPGYTLMELMIVVAIMGILLLAAPKIFKNAFRFVRLSFARAEIQKNARGSLGNINRELRQAIASSIVIDQATDMPPHSRITFTRYRPDGSTREVSYYQNGKKLYLSIDGSDGRMVADELKYIAFSYPKTDDDSIVSVSLTFEKATYEGASKALQMAVEKVRIMN